MKKIAIVGRPNVGKSALFNRICKKRISIIDDEEGVTRDRIYAIAEYLDEPFELIDTGGITQNEKMPFFKEIRIQAQVAIDQADVIIMVVDGRVGISLEDRMVVSLLHKSKKPMVLAVNKIDDPDNHYQDSEFSALGIEKEVAVSAVHGYQISELLEEALACCFEEKHALQEEKMTKLAIIGRANVGKSTLLNALINQDRAVVSDIAGTTRDHIDEKIIYNDKPYLLMDTAGIRRKCKEKTVIEKFASIRTEEVIDQANICLLMIDAMDGMTVEERRIFRKIQTKGKACLLLINKWDLISKERMEHYKKMLVENFSFLKQCPILFISAKTKRNIDQIFSHIAEIEKSYGIKISTPQLNKFIEKTMKQYSPPQYQGRRLKIYYLTQLRSFPPRFILFINDTKLFDAGYKRYLFNQFKKEFSLQGVPVLFTIKKRES